MASVHRTPHGTWRVRWRDDHGEQGRTFKTKLEADTFRKTTEAAQVQGTYVATAGGAITVAQWADVWLAGARNLGAGGRETYRRDLDRYILPALGDVQLRRLIDDRIDSFLAARLDDGLAASTVHRLYRTIRRMLQVAVEKHRLPANPCEAVTPPKIEHHEMRFLEPPQVERLADAISSRYRTWSLVAAYGGLRWSECVGLRRRDVDGDRLVVAGQLVRRADKEWHRDTPKTAAGRRTVTLPPSVAAELAEHLDRWSLPGPDGLVWPNQRAAPVNAPNFTGMVFKPALVRAGLDRGIRIHDLRHTAVALAVAAGAHPKAIQVRMGHASIAVTLDRYGHLFPEMDSTVAAGLDLLRLPRDLPRDDTGSDPPGPTQDPATPTGEGPESPT